MRKGAFTSVVITELVWIGILWVLWLAVGSYIASIDPFGTCDFINDKVNAACRETQAVEAFAWLSWIFRKHFSNFYLIYSS